MHSGKEHQITNKLRSYDFLHTYTQECIKQPKSHLVNLLTSACSVSLFVWMKVHAINMPNNAHQDHKI